MNLTNSKHSSAVAVFLFILIIALPISAVVYAQLDVPKIVSWKSGIPYDGDGDPVKVYKDTVWCKDLTRASPVYVLVNKDYVILEEKDQIGGDDPTEGFPGEKISWEGENTGWLTLTASLPEDVQRKDVVVTLQGHGGCGDYYLRAVNGYEESVELPVGTYSVAGAMISGDYAQRYQPEFGRQITIQEGTGTRLVIVFHDDVQLFSAKKGVQEQIIDEESNGTKSKTNKIKYDIALLDLIIAACLILIIVCRKVKNT